MGQNSVEPNANVEPLRNPIASLVTINTQTRKGRQLVVVGRSSLPTAYLQSEFPGAEIVETKIANLGALIFPEMDVTKGEAANFDMSVLSLTGEVSQEAGPEPGRVVGELSTKTSAVDALAYLAQYTKALSIIVLKIQIDMFHEAHQANGSWTELPTQAEVVFSTPLNRHDLLAQLVTPLVTGGSTCELLRSRGYLHQDALNGEPGTETALPWYVQSVEIQLRNPQAAEVKVLSMNQMIRIVELCKTNKLEGLKDGDMIRDTKDGRLGIYKGRMGDTVIYSHGGSIYETSFQNIDPNVKLS